MSGINFTGTGGLDRAPFTVLQNVAPIAPFGAPLADVLGVTVPESRQNRFTVIAALYFNLGIGGINLQLTTNGFFTGYYYAVSSSGGATGIVSGSFPPLIIAGPPPAFGQDFQFFLSMTNVSGPAVGDTILNFQAGENVAGTLGICLPGSYIQTIFW